MSIPFDNFKELLKTDPTRSCTFTEQKIRSYDNRAEIKVERMLLQIHPKNPQPRQIKTVVTTLSKGGAIIYPTDTIYGLGCDILQQKAIEHICRIKQVDPKRPNFHLSVQI